LIFLLIFINFLLKLGPDLKAIESMNTDIKESKQIFKVLLSIKKLDEDLEESRFNSVNQKLDELIEHFREYKTLFNSNEELKDKCERLFSELIKASSFLMNYYIEKLGKIVLNKKNIINLIDSLDINNINPENLQEFEKVLKNVEFIERNLEENFYHSNKKIILSSKIQFVGLTLRLFSKNFEELQGVSQAKNTDCFNHKEFFNKTITSFSNTLKLDPLEGKQESFKQKNNVNQQKMKENQIFKGEISVEFNKEDLVDCLEKYVQRNKSLFDLESQTFEYDKEKKSFLSHEAMFNELLKVLISTSKQKYEENADKFEEIEGFFHLNFSLIFQFL